MPCVCLLHRHCVPPLLLVHAPPHQLLHSHDLHDCHDSVCACGCLEWCGGAAHVRASVDRLGGGVADDHVGGGVADGGVAHDEHALQRL